MAESIALRCRCGAVRGELRDLSPPTCHRVTCYCDDCRAFARHLGRADLLDAHGGTEILQVTPSQVRVHQGAEQLRCVRLTPTGAFRHYLACCHTPFGNGGGPRMPVVGLPVRGLLDEGLAARRRTLDDLAGPSTGIQARFARGGAPPGAHPRLPVGVVLKLTPRFFAWWVRGKAQPSPYYDPAGAHRVTPTTLAPEARERLARDDAPTA